MECAGVCLWPGDAAPVRGFQWNAAAWSGLGADERSTQHPPLPAGAGIRQRVEKQREVVEREVTTFEPRTDYSLCQRFQ